MTRSVKRIVQVGAMLAIILLLGIWLGTPKGANGFLAPSPGASRASSARLAALDSSFRALEDGDSLSPRDRWDPEFVVATVGREPGLLYAWVAENTDWIPYLGTLRGPVGVLMDRQGNSLDRALLLARLLESAGHQVRLARGELTHEEASAVLPALVAMTAEPTPATTDADLADSIALRSVTAQYGLDPEKIREQVRAQQNGVARMQAELDARVNEQAAQLLPALGAYDADAEWGVRLAEATGALRDHWWVQIPSDTGWTDLDPLAYLVDTTVTSLIPATEFMSVEAVPAELRHRVTVRVLAEQWSNGARTERAILESVLQPAELHGQPIVLQAWPASWPKEMSADAEARYGLRHVALEQRQWGIVLAVNHQSVAQAVLSDEGNVVTPPTGGGFGGLGAAIGGLRSGERLPESRAARQELTAVWIEYDIHAPGREVRTIRRAVFDLLGPAARAASIPSQLELDEKSRLTRSLALMIRTEILPVTSRFAPDFVTHLTVRRLVESRPLFRRISQSDPSTGLPEADTMLAMAAEPISPLYSLALARLEWSEAANHTYVDRLGLLTRHRHPAVSEHGIGVRGAVDIAAGELGVSLAEPDAHRIRLRQGVLDTNAEALWWTGSAVLNAGEALASSADWVTIRPGDVSIVSSLRLPADAKARIAAELGAGTTVVAPRSPVPAGMESFVGWWSVDPATGSVRGIGGHGWGQCAPEYNVTLEAVVIQAARNFAFEYGLCQGIAQSINGFRTMGAELQARDLWFWWLPPIESSDPLELFKANNKTCLISAMAAGFLATMPLLLQMRRAAWLRALAKGRRFMRDERGAIRFPPGRIPRPRPAIPRRPTPAGGYDAPADPRGPTLPDYRNTQANRPPLPLEGPPAPARPRPQTPGEAADNLKKADAARGTAMQRSATAAEDYVRYKSYKPNPHADWPGDPSKYDPDMAEMLRRDWEAAHGNAIDAINEFRAAERDVKAFKDAAQDLRAAERGRQGRGGFPAPNRPAEPLPQPAPIPGPSSGDHLAAGSSGVASSSLPNPE